MKKNSDEKAVDGSEHDEEQLFDVEDGAEDGANPFEADSKDKREFYEIPKKDRSANEMVELEEVSAKAPAIRKNCVATPYDDKPAQPKKNAVVAKASAISEGKKLEMLKKKVSEAKKRQSNAKKRSQRQRKVKQVQESQKEIAVKKESKVAKKTIGERFREKFKAVTNFFTSGTQAQKAQRRAQAKLSSMTMKNVAEGDDTMPNAGKRPVQHPSDNVWDEDVWIEDPTVLTDRRHRSDLTMVVNNDNGGQLWHEGKRPFWKDKTLQKEVPAAPSEKPVSKLLVDVVSNKTPLAEPAPEPSWDELAPIDELISKDTKWFQEEQVMSNTIRSIVCSMNESTRPTMITGVPARKLAIAEPTTTTVYYRHNNNHREAIPFTKSPFGKAKKLRSKLKGSKSNSSSISSNSAKDKKVKN